MARHAPPAVPPLLKDLNLNEGSLTGEAMPVEKEAGVDGERAALKMGTSVLSGTGLMLVVATGGGPYMGRRVV